MFDQQMFEQMADATLEALDDYAGSEAYRVLMEHGSISINKLSLKLLIELKDKPRRVRDYVRQWAMLEFNLRWAGLEIVEGIVQKPRRRKK